MHRQTKDGNNTLLTIVHSVMQKATSEMLVDEINGFMKFFLYESIWLQSRYLLRENTKSTQQVRKY
jgi:predicted nucleotide-binding protein (sugar kinase/HSP70/actin superfamily)